ncbi:MBL fold metallo-hydrolase [Microbulbifer spongiae]|uniref:MBL fold metallo-hydrolase n=1 Tax=Microbulbifer spongiae TaxID=2944933 RepID=A0ABY9ECV7_9GAMM|nr:MBL fold metallo-hydrolase [Microbulbifer sp. MI-G]WKD49801.1 MBL fold metallo-hydrolase [Microbulbifer sp. MI-G]
MKYLTAIFIVVILAACASSYMDKRHISPNFENEVFKNTNPVNFLSFWEMFKAALESDVEPAVWPEWIDIHTDTSPIKRVSDSNTRITFINHATFLIQTGEFNILTDPVFSERTSPFSFVGPKRVHRPGIAIENLPPIDVIVISHDHYDHLDLNSIQALAERDNPKLYMGLGVGARLSGSEQIIELDWWESSRVADNFQLWFLDVQHFSGRWLTDRNSTLWGGFLLEIDGQKIYFGGDSGYADHYKRTFERFGPVDIAFLPIGAYAPREFFQEVHMDPSDAVQAHLDLQAGISIGMHYGTFQLTAEAINEPIKFLEEAKKKANIKPSEFITLEVGQPFELTSESFVRKTGLE